MPHAVAFLVERLTIINWLFVVWPRLLAKRARGAAVRCFVLEASPMLLLLARLTGALARTSVDLLPFRIMEVHDEDGRLARLRVPHHDLPEMQRRVMSDPRVREVTLRHPEHLRLATFLAKSHASVSLYDRYSHYRALLVMQICRWARRELALPSAVLFLERRPWMHVLIRHAAEQDLAVVPVPSAVDVRGTMRRLLGPRLLGVLRALRYRMPGRVRRPRPDGAIPDSAAPARFCLAVQFAGQLNLDRPERYSDLFFWPQANLRAEDLLVVFITPAVPVDEEKASELRRHRLRAVALHPGATRVADVPVVVPRARPSKKAGWVRGNSREARWLRAHVCTYDRLVGEWVDIFVRHRVGIYLTWFKYDALHFAVADALQSLGGITAIYQRSYELISSPELAGTADVMFGFSRLGADVEQRSGSTIPYYVITGYLGDHRFPLLRAPAQSLRQRLARHGAERVLAYFDENSHDDARWVSGHQFTRENYAFLLEKVVQEPWFGLVVKPKVPRTLRRRLGPVASLLEQAECTGRCLVLEGGDLHGFSPPAAAALAADVAVHGHMVAATAGIEAALAGVRTVLLDREGWPPSPLYRLGTNRVVFRRWEDLWLALDEHWRRPEGVPGFGDWTQLLDDLDPFRDGRAATRMGMYLHWLLRGLQAGHAREIVMAEAADRYVAQWGAGSVMSIGLTESLAARVESAPPGKDMTTGGRT